MSAFEKRYRDRFGIDCTDAAPSPDDAVLSLLARRSVRRYTPDPVPEPLLTALLAAAQSAPTKSNLQQYSILVIDDPARRQRLADLIPTCAWAAAAPRFLLFLGDIRRGRRIAGMRGYTHRNDNLDTFMNAAVDAALAMQCLIVAAEASGLGCCPISMVRNDPEALAQLVDLPDGVFPVAGLAMGWPDETPAVSLRLPPSVVVHRDGYDDSGLEAAVSPYDERVFAAKPIPPEKQRHVDRYGVAERGTWSENVARQLSVPERDGFRDWLAGKGVKAG